MYSKICLIYGNCQVDTIQAQLESSPSFKEEYSEIITLKVYLLSIEDIKLYLEELIPTIDLLIAHPISSNYKGTNLFSLETIAKNLSLGAQVLVVPNLYFGGFFPEMIYLYQEEGGHYAVSDITYHDKNILSKWLSEKSETDQSNNQSNIELDVYPVENENFYTKDQILAFFNSSLQELKRRENLRRYIFHPIDIIMTDFIEQKYKERKLFHTLNHPTRYLVEELCRRILNFLNMDPFMDNEIDPLEEIQFPFYSSVHKHLGCTFENPLVYRRFHKIRKAKPFYQLYYNFYEKMPKNILDFNREKYQL